MWPAWSARLAIAGGACAAGFAVAWLWQGANVRAAESDRRAEVAELRAQVEKARADGEAAGRQAMQVQVARTLEATNERAAELARLAADAARRPPAVLRVCPPDDPHVPAAGGGEAGPAAGDDVRAGGPGRGDGADPGAVLAAQLRRFALERAEALNLDLRAVVTACR